MFDTTIGSYRCGHSRGTSSRHEGGIFRTSFTNWQPAYGMGRALAAQGIKRAAWVSWDYAAGKEAGEGFADGLRAGGAELVAQEEVFGPVLSVIPFDTEGEAIGIANATRYGLAAGIWTESLPRAMRVSRAIRAGTVWVNTYRAVAVQARLAGSHRAWIVWCLSRRSVEHLHGKDPDLMGGETASPQRLQSRVRA